MIDTYTYNKSLKLKNRANFLTPLTEVGLLKL
jgi:hypothetical protein